VSAACQRFTAPAVGTTAGSGVSAWLKSGESAKGALIVITGV